MPLSIGLEAFQCQSAKGECVLQRILDAWLDQLGLLKDPRPIL